MGASQCVCPGNWTPTGQECLGAIYATEGDTVEHRDWALRGALKNWELFLSFLDSCEAWQKKKHNWSAPRSPNFPPESSLEAQGLEVFQQTLTVMNFNYIN